MILSDRTILEEIGAKHLSILPLHPDDIQPASVDVHLHNTFIRVRAGVYIDVNTAPVPITETLEVSVYTLLPNQFVLASTLEFIELPNNIMARVEGCSSLMRLGLFSMSGYVDPGWKGRLTLELKNFSSVPIVLQHGMKIGQLSFQYLTSDAKRPYGTSGLGSHYQGQPEATRNLA